MIVLRRGRRHSVPSDFVKRPVCEEPANQQLRPRFLTRTPFGVAVSRSARSQSAVGVALSPRRRLRPPSALRSSAKESLNCQKPDACAAALGGGTRNARDSSASRISLERGPRHSAPSRAFVHAPPHGIEQFRTTAPVDGGAAPSRPRAPARCLSPARSRRPARSARVALR